MKKTIKKLASLFLAVLMIMSICSLTAFAANDVDTADDDDTATNVTVDLDTLLPADDTSIPEEDTLLASAVNKSIYSDSWTLIYTGKGVDRWLHITPWTVPNVFTIKMLGYGGSNDVLYQETFTTMGTTHWFVGSDVRQVLLMGVPGGAVTVTDTEH